ncbi:MAG: tetratricopeptide repeat protein [Aliarcobacter sp.]
MKSSPLITLFLFLTSAIVTQASSTAPVSETYSHPLLNQIYEMHSLAESGNEDATRRLVAWLEELTAEQPENGILLVYLGSAYTLASRDAFIGPGKLRYLMSGRDCMDRAVALRPEDPNVRFIRGINNYHLPTLFNRRSIARDDFRKLVDQLSQNPKCLDPLTSQAIYYYAGLCFAQLEEEKNARNSWQKGLDLKISGPLTAKITQELDQLTPTAAGK